MDDSTVASPPLDIEAFRLSMRTAGVEEIVEPTLVVFAEEAAKLVATLRNAVRRTDSEEARRAAHTLKGSAGNVRARELARVAESLERLAEQADFGAAEALLDVADNEYAAVIEHLHMNGLGQ